MSADDHLRCADAGFLTPDEIARFQRSRPVSPPLMFFADRKMSGDDHAHFRAALGDFNLIVVTPGFAVFQCIDGRWQQIKPEGE
jgi:hypothetical protein